MNLFDANEKRVLPLDVKSPFTTDPENSAGKRDT